jgi:hypothetical protein
MSTVKAFITRHPVRGATLSPEVRARVLLSLPSPSGLHVTTDD